MKVCCTCKLPKECDEFSKNKVFNNIKGVGSHKPRTSALRLG